MTLKYLTVLVVLVLVACTPKIEDAPQPGDVYFVDAFEWHILDQKDLEKAYTRYNMPFKEGDHLDGFQGWSPSKDDPNRVAVVFSAAPKRVNDKVTCTFGHEVMHIPLGPYHPQNTDKASQ